MNLKKIAGMCKSAGSFHVTNIVNSDGEITDQWVILGPASYRVDNMGLTANMLARFAGIKDVQLDNYVLQDESRKEVDWMRDYPRSIPSQEVCRATVGLILGGHEIRLYRIVGQSVIVPVNADYLAPLEGTEYFVRSAEGKPVLAVKNGMYIEAVISPYDAFGEQAGVPLPGLKAALIEATGIWRWQR